MRGSRAITRIICLRCVKASFTPYFFAPATGAANTLPAGCQSEITSGYREDNSITITATELRDLLVYDPETGQFVYNKTRGNRSKGTVAGTINKFTMA